MLRIRKEQDDELAKAALKSFEERMMAHLRKNQPEKYNELGQEAVRESIQTGITTAKTYGVEFEYDVARFIELMYTLTFDFDTNPRTQWAAEILNEPNIDGRMKMDDLCERAERELKTLSDRQAGGN